MTSITRFCTGEFTLNKIRHRFCLFLLMLSISTVTFSQNSHVEAGLSVIEVSDISSLYNALKRANKNGKTKILLAPGTYQLNKPLLISAAHISLIGDQLNPADTRIIGLGMRRRGQVENIITVHAKYFTLDGITLAEAGNHLIQISGERDADFPTLKNCILQDSYQQLIKVSSGGKSKNSSDYGVVENCEFAYTKGIGPNYYIGGIDAHGSRGWMVAHNRFKDIASPDKRVAEFAVHFWNGASNNTVQNNTIINCDRGIGFGLKGKPASGGAIIENLIIHYDDKDPNADVGISLEQSPDTQILDNRIYLGHNYPNAIEYRFTDTKNIVIADNITNKPVRKRNGAQGMLINNTRVKNLKEMLSKEERTQFEALFWPENQ
ncbi:hypothetical protein Patl_1176 [Paraglaciecola sp. T6c]|uniref:right-handed parallel beta-helix repeat-containing protein n=1 Tax=Pseudoalteromonas atlantica (strain T6c / ATCC BAA-1087) TaxID=3042615 RepID=UPI00005C70F9|nr:right-handed parallel beta-helix repeat-containing protein [Paraglaciecola sp. T6c]ABG39702.1 hypothetical protein Patl_1176 [Paraglaciecola sp. T6c]